MPMVGISSTGRYVPKHAIFIKDIAEAEGLTEKEITAMGTNKVYAAKDEEPTDMGIKAAEIAIAKGGISPEEIDVVVYANTFADYLRWSDAARIQHEIGARNAYAFRIEQFCCGGMAAMDFAFSRLQTDLDLRHILVVCADKYEKPVVNRWKAASANFYGDGASAALLKRGNTGFRILGTHALTDGSFHHLWRIPVGGVRCPATVENIAQGAFHLDCKKTAAEYLSDDAKREQLYSTLANNNKKVMIELLNRLGYTVEDVDKVVLYNIGKHVLDKVIQTIEFPEEKTSAYISYEHGHMGPADIFFNLDKMQEDGKFEKGDKIMLFSAGAGFSWASALVEYVGNAHV
ncbi:3-oxoacyl-ACP synthase III family protein [Thermotalea metallivorans]|uniref:3-oxoacyl-[acyl-carrier-protein] synthase 3 n=1 Tax=Thermotalea metallivorans TaxID=520762 RepID=A0A140L795_9FIRM|nr:3-oxoacyl-[acyl-carrier-protein] synthase III C-terminal domain-containing protein [Thermotalea metallivorans]KXG76420.1 3-oxoacyl-[acyl-carrier-protein] synthase 3 [Thermotalea metallivorans]